jgi:FixJ family two-component response regulator
MDQGPILFAVKSGYIFYKKSMNAQTYLYNKKQKAKKMKPVIYIVDDDESVRRAMKRLIRSAGMEAQTFASAHKLLDFELRKHNACMIVDVKMSGMSGLELQDELRAKGSDLPVIFITGFDTPETRDQAKKAGAAGYFRKPVDDQALLDSIQWVLSRQKPYQDSG